MNARHTLAVAKASSGANELLAASPGVIYRVVGYCLTGASTVTFKFQSASTDLTGAQTMAAGVSNPYFAPLRYKSDPTCICQTVAGEALNLRLSDAVAVGGFIIYERITA